MFSVFKIHFLLINELLMAGDIQCRRITYYSHFKQCIVVMETFTLLDSVAKCTISENTSYFLNHNNVDNCVLFHLRFIGLFKLYFWKTYSPNDTFHVWKPLIVVCKGSGLLRNWQTLLTFLSLRPQSGTFEVESHAFGRNRWWLCSHQFYRRPRI